MNLFLILFFKASSNQAKEKPETSEDEVEIIKKDLDIVSILLKLINIIQVPINKDAPSKSLDSSPKKVIIHFDKF